MASPPPQPPPKPKLLESEESLGRFFSRIKPRTTSAVSPETKTTTTSSKPRSTPKRKVKPAPRPPPEPATSDSGEEDEDRDEVEETEEDTVADDESVMDVGADTEGDELTDKKTQSSSSRGRYRGRGRGRGQGGRGRGRGTGGGVQDAVKDEVPEVDVPPKPKLLETRKPLSFWKKSPIAKTTPRTFSPSPKPKPYTYTPLTSRTNKKKWTPTSGSGKSRKKRNRRFSKDTKVYNTRHVKKTKFGDWRRDAAGFLPSVTAKHLIADKDSEMGEGPSKVPSTTTLDETNKIDDAAALAIQRKKRQSFANQLSTFRKSKMEEGSDEEIGMMRRDTVEDEKKLKEEIAALKESCEPLHVKREKRKEILEEGQTNTKYYHDPNQTHVKERLISWAHRVASIYEDIINFFTIWEKDIHEINCRFGTVVVSYFVWLRRMIKLNILTFLIVLFCIILPEFFEDRLHEHVVEKGEEKRFHISHLLHGEGYFHYSYLYYSGYHSRIKPGNQYDIFDDAAMRFCFTIILLFILNTYFLFTLIKSYYRSVRLESKVVGMAKMETFKSVICAWDFSCGDERASKFLHKMIRQHLYILSKGTKEEDREKIEINEMEEFEVLGWFVSHLGLQQGNFMMHVVSNMTALACCLVMGLVLLLLCAFKVAYYLECVTERDDGKTRELPESELCPGGDLSYQTLILSLPTLFLSMISRFLMKLMTTVGEMEHFSKPENRFYATMVRGWIFNFLLTYLFLSFWLIEGEQLSEKGYVTETIFGKEMYRVVVIQGVIDTVIMFFLQYIYHRVRLWMNKDYRKSRFHAEYCAQEMFYMDSISRFGTMFCPPISLLVTFRLVADFYLNKYILINFSRHDTYMAQSGFIYVPYLLTYFLGYLSALGLLVYLLTRVTPSQIDGPFLNYTNSYMEVVNEMVDRSSLTRWMGSLFAPGSLTIILSILISLVYFVKQWAKAYEPVLEEVNNLIVLERADKEVLLRAYFEIARVTDQKGKGGDGADDKIEKLLHQARRRNTFAPGQAQDPMALLRQFQQNGLNRHRNQMQNIVDEIVEERRQKRKNIVLSEAPTTAQLKRLIRRHEMEMAGTQYTEKQSTTDFFARKEDPRGIRWKF